jgi:microcystin-dependent protein
MPNLTTNYSFNLPLVNNATDADLWGGQLNSNWTSIDALLKTASNAICPVGSMLDYGGTAAPTYWLLCYGQAIDRTTYSALFTAIGTTFGVGDGVATFNVPDIRGRVTAGQDDMGGSSANRLTGLTGGVDGDVLGGVGGLETHTLAVTEIPALTYTISGTGPAGGTTGTRLAFINASNNAGDVTATAAVTTNAGGGAHNNVQPTIIVNKIIYAGV